VDMYSLFTPGATTVELIAHPPCGSVNRSQTSMLINLFLIQLICTAHKTNDQRDFGWILASN